MAAQAFIIEDNYELGAIFADLFSMLDIQAEVIRDGQIASQKLNESIPDFVMLDMHLPHVSGLQLLDQIRGDERLRLTRVMVVTADSLQADQARGKADLVFVKPISLSQVHEIIAKVAPGHSE